MGCVQPNEKQESFPQEKTTPNQSFINNPYLPDKETLKPLQPNIDREVEDKPKEKKLIKRKNSLAKLFQEHRKKQQNHKQTIPFKYISSSQTENTKQTITPTRQAPLKSNMEDHLRALKKMIEQQGEDITACGICLEEYDLAEREPMMVCMNQHTFCSKCLRDLASKGYSKCPLDQEAFDVKEVKKNRIVCQLLSKIKDNQSDK